MTALRDAYPPVGKPVWRDGRCNEWVLVVCGETTRYFMWFSVDGDVQEDVDETTDAWEAV
jgi:hypothetical protein